MKEAHEVFELYDADSSGSIDAGELMDIMRLLGQVLLKVCDPWVKLDNISFVQDPSQEEVDRLVHEVDENENGDLVRLSSFPLHVHKLVSRQQDALTTRR